MNSRKLILKQTAIIAVGQAICVAAMIGVFALIGRFDSEVLLGGVVGGILAILNFFFMAVGAMMAADKATEQNVKGGNAIIKLSYTARIVVLAVVLFAFAKSGYCNVVTLVVPLIFPRFTLTLTEFFRKPEGNKV